MKDSRSNRDEIIISFNKFATGSQRVRAFRKRLRTHQEGRMGITDLGGRRPLYLRNPMEGTRGNFGSLKE
jgi:hypothetical protein